MSLLVRISERAGKFGFWRALVNFWTLLFFVAIIYDFFHANILGMNNIILTIAAIYCAALAIYSAEKEFRRWHRSHSSMHPGEIYAILWTILIMGIIIGQATLDISYEIPPEVSASYIAVITILAITRESKNQYKKRNR